MVGVTIGVNQLYESMARLAAHCFQEMTGLECIVLGESDFIKSGLHHPAALKLKLFDLIEDESVIYFDADWFCMKPCSFKSFIEAVPVVACNDFILTDDWPSQYSSTVASKDFYYPGDIRSSNCKANIRNDYISEVANFSKLSKHCTEWINTGFFIINKKNHEPWLATSLDHYVSGMGHHSQYFEQPAMNKALEQLGLDVQYLGREYNTLIASRTRWPSSIIGLHLKLKHHKDFVQQVLKNNITSIKQVSEYFLYD